MLFFGKKKIVGIDIGTSTIKLAELDVSRSSASLVSFGITPTPAQSFASGDIMNPANIGDAIRILIDQVKTKRKHAACGLGGSSVIVKRISIPKMDENLIAEQIRWEAEQYVPYDINEVNLGYEILRNSGSSESIDLLLIAAVQAHVFKYAESLQIAGLECNVIDVNGFALANCFTRNYGDMSGQTVAILNVGSSATNMVIIENSEVTFSRDIAVGGLTYTHDLQKGLNVSVEEAEAIKLSLSSRQAAPQEALALVEATHEAIVEEIKMSFDFFLNSARSQNINRCFVTGGGSKTLGFLDRLAKTVPCEKFDPFFNIKYSGKVFSRDYLEQIRDFSAVVLGLALRAPGDG